MRVVVTGGSGKLGREVIALLASQGHAVFNLDVVPPRQLTEDFTRIALTDYGQVIDAFEGIDARHAGFDALVHLAAVPGPGHVPDIQMFHNNMIVSFNVFHAAQRAGIKNIVYASSETLLGVPFIADPPYIPVDEEYPARPEWVYSLVKHLEETMAKEFVRWDPELKIVGLRFSYVMDVDNYATFPQLDLDPSRQDWNLWSYVDSRDAAQAVGKALVYDMTGFEAFIIAADDTVMSRSSASLVAGRFPDVPVRADLGEHQSMLSSEKAKRILGYRPAHSWRDHAAPLTSSSSSV